MRFSVTIPSYKQKYLSEAIESVLSQSYTDFELIIVDDHSPEDLYQVISKYNDKRIKYYRNDKNCGAIDVVDNWNICLSKCTGEYIICMGDDDRLLPCCLEEYDKLITKYPELGVYHAWTELIDEDSNFKTLQHPRPEYECCLSLIWNRWNGRYRQYIGDFCFDTAKLKSDGGFYKLDYAWGSDDITAVRAARYGGIASTQKLCFQYRENRYTISSTGNIDIKMDSILEERIWYYDFLRNYSVNSDIEEKYLKCLNEEIEQNYKVKFKNTMIGELRSHPMHFFHFLKIKKKYGLSTMRILMALKDSIEVRFHGR